METELPLTVTTSSGFFDFAHLIGIAFVRNPSGKVKPARKPAWILQKAMCSNPVAPILLRQGSNAVRPPARQRLQKAKPKRGARVPEGHPVAPILLRQGYSTLWALQLGSAAEGKVSMPRATFMPSTTKSRFVPASEISVSLVGIVSLFLF